MTESSAPRAPTPAHYAPALENITLVITVVSGVGMTTKWLDPVVSFAVVSGLFHRRGGRTLSPESTKCTALYLPRIEHGLWGYQLDVILASSLDCGSVCH